MKVADKLKTNELSYCKNKNGKKQLEHACNSRSIKKNYLFY